MTSPDLLANSDLVLVQRRTVHAGRLPDPATLQGLVSIYPDAAKAIFDDFHAQSAHRRDLERLRIITGNTLALRSQMIGGALGVIGLVGSFVIAGLGREWAASAIGSVSLVSVVVLGRDRQKKERIEKTAASPKPPQKTSRPPSKAKGKSGYSWRNSADGALGTRPALSVEFDGSDPDLHLLVGH